ncbi:MAG: hypothetical protein Q7S11_00605 [bacterium]|nr:hypothetical protein [bacterium]
MSAIVRIELTLCNYKPNASIIFIEGGVNNDERSAHSPASFNAGLKEIILKAFEDMVRFEIWKVRGEGVVVTTTQENPKSLEHFTAIDDEAMEILTPGGYKTFDSYKKDRVVNIDTAIMLLVWKWSSFLDGSAHSSHRECVVCGKKHSGKEHKYHRGLMPPPSMNIPPFEMYSYPYTHCINPECFSHEIERMIDPAYIFTPPKSGDDLEGALQKAIDENPALLKGFDDFR